MLPVAAAAAAAAVGGSRRAPRDLQPQVLHHVVQHAAAQPAHQVCDRARRARLGSKRLLQRDQRAAAAALLLLRAAAAARGQDACGRPRAATGLVGGRASLSLWSATRQAASASHHAAA
jgi:hypothetical protein